MRMMNLIQITSSSLGWVLIKGVIIGQEEVHPTQDKTRYHLLPEVLKTCQKTTSQSHCWCVVKLVEPPDRRFSNHQKYLGRMHNNMGQCLH